MLAGVSPFDGLPGSWGLCPGAEHGPGGAGAAFPSTVRSPSMDAGNAFCGWRDEHRT